MTKSLRDDECEVIGPRCTDAGVRVTGDSAEEYEQAKIGQDMSQERCHWGDGSVGWGGLDLTAGVALRHHGVSGLSDVRHV